MSLERLRVGALVLAVLAVLAAPLGAATRALDCNSSLDIQIDVPMPMLGSTVPVALTVVSGPATDAANQPITQTFNQVTFWPACQSTLPCVEDPGAIVFPMQTIGGDCGGVTASAPGMNGAITMTLDPLVLGPAAGPTETTQCMIEFNVEIGTDPTLIGREISMQAETAGNCESGLTSAAEDTASLVPIPDDVPALGTIALAILAGLLILGSWLMLRRQRPARTHSMS